MGAVINGADAGGTACNARDDVENPASGMFRVFCSVSAIGVASAGCDDGPG